MISKLTSTTGVEANLESGHRITNILKILKIPAPPIMVIVTGSPVKPLVGGN